MNFLWAFLVGGALCAAGQLLIDLTPLTPARILTGYVVAGVVLSAVGLYGPLAPASVICWPRACRRPWPNRGCPAFLPVV